MTLSDIVNSNFELTGQIVAVNSNGAGVLIRPLTSGVQNSQIRIQHVVGKKIPYATNVVIDPALQSIENSEFHLHELNAGYFGITVANPSSLTYFRNNFVRSLHVHAIEHIGVQFGQSGNNSSRIQSNTAEIRFNSDGVGGGASHAALQVWGSSNSVDLIALGAGISYGAKFEPSSANNILYYGALQAATAYVDYGTNNQFIFGPPMGAGGSMGERQVPAGGETTDNTASSIGSVELYGAGFYDSQQDDELLGLLSLLTSSPPEERKATDFSVDAAFEQWMVEPIEESLTEAAVP
jgi:hypothetical protein